MITPPPEFANATISLMTSHQASADDRSNSRLKSTYFDSRIAVSARRTSVWRLRLLMLSGISEDGAAEPQRHSSLLVQDSTAARQRPGPGIGRDSEDCPSWCHPARSSDT